MSAIVGTYWLDGRPSGDAALRRMLATMPHRGPDGCDVWHEGPVGLGHAMLHTTPESLHETLPLTNAAGTLAITADARIDNRAELIHQLRLNDVAGSIPDSALILHAYERWGERCVEHLLGDFAFAIWDAGKRQLFCARDHFGVRQFYYYRSRTLFAFGTEIKALLSLPEVPETINERILAEFFTFKLVDTVDTVFEGIKRIPAGHAAVVSAEGFRQWKYWEPTPAKVDQHLSDEEYAREFLRLFTEAVSSRIRSVYPVGAELSGGLDSSFVACLASDLLQEQRGLPLRTVSLVYDRFSGCDERAYIKKVVEAKNLEPHFVSAEEDGILGLMDEIYEFLDDGRASGNHHLNWLTARGAGRAGVRVLLSGQDGDSVVSHGWLLFRELAEAEQWEAFAHEAARVIDRLRKERDRYALQESYSTKVDILNAYAGPVLRDWAIEKRLLPLLRATRAIQTHFGVPRGKILKRLRKELLYPRLVHRIRQQRRVQYAEKTFVPEELNRNLAEKYDIGRRVAAVALKAKVPTVRGEQKANLETPYVQTVFEKLDHYAAAHGVEVRHPFMDVRLVEYCLGLPARQSLQDGWTRAIMRRAMRGIVPDAVRLRVGKTFLGDPYRTLLLEFDVERAAELIERADLLAPFVDPGHIRSMYARRDELSQDACYALGRILSLLLWESKRRGRRYKEPHPSVRQVDVACSKS